jgi:hypothetical protein
MSEQGQAGPPSGPGGFPFPPNLGSPHAKRERKPWPPLPDRLERYGRRKVLAAGAALLLLIIGGISLSVFAAKVKALRERHATGPSWAFPSLVYSDGVSLVPGRALPRGYLLKHLEARAYQEIPLAIDDTTRGLVSEFPETPGTYAWEGDSAIVIALRGFDMAKDPEGSGGPERVRLTLRQGMLT